MLFFSLFAVTFRHELTDEIYIVDTLISAVDNDFPRYAYNGK